MSAFRGRGSYWGPRPAGPSTSAASGWWSAAGQFLYERDGAWPSAVETDPNFSSVALLLHMDGSNGATTFTDSSSNAVALTANGDAKISTAQSKFGTASGLFDGNGDWVHAADNNLWDFVNSGDFTLEFFVRFASTDATAFCGQSNGGGTVPKWGLYFNDGATIGANKLGYILATSVSSDFTISASWSPTTSQWYHVASTRSGNDYRFFIDGVQIGTTLTSSYRPATSTGQLRIGSDGEQYRLLNGNLDEFRITKGVARYTAAFTAPTAPFPDA